MVTLSLVLKPVSIEVEELCLRCSGGETNVSVHCFGCCSFWGLYQPQLLGVMNLDPGATTAILRQPTAIPCPQRRRASSRIFNCRTETGIERYAELLAPEFLFQLEPANANEIGTQFLTRDQDSTGTRALLTTTQVSDIHINLIYGNRDSSVNVSPPVDSLKVRIITTDLQINEADTLIWVVNNQQDLFFRRGKEERGEDPSRWFIYEWDELPALSSPGGRVELTTWAKLKTQYFD